MQTLIHQTFLVKMKIAFNLVYHLLKAIKTIRIYGLKRLLFFEFCIGI
jgi:hypothetical protein